MTQLSNVPMQPNPNTVERPMTLIEKLNAEAVKQENLWLNGKSIEAMKYYRGVKDGLTTAINIIKQHEAESEAQDD